MFDDIELMMKAEKDETIVNKIELKDLGACLDALMFHSVEFSISEDECKQISNLSQLIYNYNDNLYKDRSIKIRSTFLTNFVDGFISFRDCINIVRNLNTTMNKYSNFNPPTFELSKHYIDSIYEKESNKSGD